MAEHPAPWRWRLVEGGDHEGYEDFLADADGESVICAVDKNGDDAFIACDDDGVRALTEAAPDLRFALAWALRALDGELSREEKADCRVACRALLARLEGRSRG